MLRKLLLPFLFVAFFANMAFAQTGSITGTVTNEEGEPVPTANVLLVEAGLGDATNLEGEYSIDNVEAGTYTLRITFVGYAEYTDQVTIEAGQTLENNVTLQRGAVGLEELVVTGYGLVSKIDRTSAVATVETEEVESVPIASTEELLYGRAAGVKISSTSGQPGAGFEVRIRGARSFGAGSRPLWIVDGIQISFQEGSSEGPTSPLNFLDPDNIASFEVLKGAAATAIYGASGSNGVILITTKAGRPGPTQITASVSRGVSTPIQPIDLMNTDQWTEYFIQGLVNVTGGAFSRQQATDFLIANIFPAFGYPGIESLDELRYTDWVDFMYRQGTIAEYDLSFSGGDEKTRFYIAGGYTEQEGQIKTTDLTKYDLRANLQHTISDDFSLGVNLALSNSVSNFICEDGFFINCPVSQSVLEFPFTYPYDDDGSYNDALRFGLVSNTAMIFNEQRQYSDIFHLVGSLTGTYNFTDWLSLTTQFSMDFRQLSDYQYRSPVYAAGLGGFVQKRSARVANINTNAVLNFRQTFNANHNVFGILGVEYRRDYSIEHGGFGIGLPGSLFTVLSATSEPGSVFGDNDEFRQAGYFGKIRYDYDSRYFFSLSARYDGSSRFGRENRWGLFPAASVGWRISEEDFFTVDFIDNLMLRAEYGLTGNSQIGFYQALGLYSVSGLYAGVVGLNPSQLANPRLTWEDKVSAGIGLDYSMFNGRVSGAINVYQSTRQSMLLGVPLPSTSSFEEITQNIGKLRTRGVEFKVQTINVATGDFYWSTNFNISLYDNEVLELTKGITELNPNSIVPIEIGHSFFDLKMIRWAGVNPVDGRPMWYNKDGTLTYNPVFADDAVYTGETGEIPIAGGLGNTISYKGLALSVFFQYSFGQTAQPRTVFFFGQAQMGVTFTNGRVEALTEAWQEPGDLVGIPKPWAFAGSSQYPGTDFYSQSSSNSFYDASYIRLKNVTLSYSLPTSVTEALNLQGIELYVAGYNLKTWSAYPGYDPEDADVFRESSFPVARRFNGGIEVQF